MSDSLLPTLILAGVALVVAGSYLLAWRSKSKKLQRTGSSLFGAITGFASLVIAAAAIRLLRDFESPGASFTVTLIAEIILFAVAAGLGFVAIRSLERNGSG